MENPIKKCVLHGAVNNETVDLYPRTNLASVADMTAFARTLNGAADAAAARNTLEITTQAALINIIYPVGSVITLTNDTNPNKIFNGTTWQKMDAGRVLVSAGTYTEDGETYTYALGDKGGEAKHQLTIEEMPAHGHDGSVSTAALTGSITNRGSEENKITVSGIFMKSSTSQDYNGGVSGGNKAPVISCNATHSHSLSVNNTGKNKRHENRMPFTVVSRWYRTA